METIFLTSGSTLLRKLLLVELVCVTPTTANFGAALDEFLPYASRREPRVDVYEWINSLVGELACRGNPAKAPVSNHQSLPLKMPCYNIRQFSGKIE
jgi:hypothetical protein